MINNPKSKRTTRYKNADEEGTSRLVSLVAKNDTQKLYINELKTEPVVVVLGPSGTGKTYCAAVHAANLYSAKKISKIIITRPAVSVGKSLGALPGSLDEKFGPWLAPVLDVLIDTLGKGVVETAMKNGNIEMAPLEYVRGRSFSDAMILLDEAQNTTVQEMMMFLTRIGDNCKVVINGDIKQSDIKEQSGLSKVLHLAKKYDMNVPVIEFTVDDIVRSDTCKQWVIAFYEEGLM